MSEQTHPPREPMWSMVMGIAAAGMGFAAWLVLYNRDDYVLAAGLNGLCAAECLRRTLSYLAPRRLRVPHALAWLFSCVVVAVMTVGGAARHNAANDSWNLMRGILPVLAVLAGVGAYLTGWLVTLTLFKVLPPAWQRRFSWGVLFLLLAVPAAMLVPHTLRVWESRAHRLDTRPWMLRWTFKLGSETSRWLVASNPSASLDLIRDIASQPPSSPTDAFIREAACANRVLPPEEIQRLLAAAPSLACKKGLANNPNTSPELLVRLADEQEVWWHLAFNARTPREVLLRIFEEPRLRDSLLNQTVPYRVVLGRFDERFIPSSTLEGLASDERASPALLGALAKYSFPNVRKAVAGNPRTPREVLERLAQDSDPKVQRLAQQRLQQEPQAP